MNRRLRAAIVTAVTVGALLTIIGLAGAGEEPPTTTWYNGGEATIEAIAERTMLAMCDRDPDRC